MSFLASLSLLFGPRADPGTQDVPHLKCALVSYHTIYDANPTGLYLLRELKRQQKAPLATSSCCLDEAASGDNQLDSHERGVPAEDTPESSNARMKQKFSFL